MGQGNQATDGGGGKIRQGPVNNSGNPICRMKNGADAERALSVHWKKAGLRDAANTWLLLGITRTRVEKWDAAILAFRKAAEDDETAKDAFRWIRSIERQLSAQKEARRVKIRLIRVCKTIAIMKPYREL